MNVCYIFGAMPVNDFNYTIDNNDIVIAADKGLKNTERFNIIPDYIVGDFDSLGYTPEGNKTIKHPVMKNETDLILAVDIGFEKGYTDFIIYGCIGGRLDQTVASIQTASYIAQKGGKSIFRDNKTYLTVIKNTTIRFDEKCKGTISCFAYGSNAIGVSEQGLLYEINDTELNCNFPIGVSNEFMSKEATICVRNGSLCIIWETENGTYSFGG